MGRIIGKIGPAPFGECHHCGAKSHRELYLAWRCSLLPIFAALLENPPRREERTSIFCSDECEGKALRHWIAWPNPYLMPLRIEPPRF